MAEEPVPPKPSKPAARIDIATIGGLILALAGILGGLILEKGKLSDVMQFTAALIVIGGTVGAVMVATPLSIMTGAARRLVDVIRDSAQPLGQVLEEIITHATKARKQGLVSLEHDCENVADLFLKKGLMLAVDGTDVQEIRGMLELEIGLEEARADAEAKVFESAGGYAPTIGIIGAVLGLIQVMKNLANIEEVGHGIAVAFVATVYGVALANIVLLPASQKIKARAHQETQRRELVLEGVAGIVEGLNPKLLRTKLEAYAHGAPAKSAKGSPKSASAPSEASPEPA